MKDELSAASVREALATRYVGRNLIYLDSTTSTQDRARWEAEAGAPEGTTVVADEQTAGRGRFQRSWVSPRGRAIYLSLVLRPRPAELLKLNMVASLAVARAVRAVTGLEPQIKWPNDVQLSGKKLAGMLVDTAMQEGSVDYAVVGIGLNVGLDPSQHPEIADIATSLSWELHSPVQRLPVLSALLLYLEKLYESVKRGESLLAEWKPCLGTLGQSVRVTWPGDAEKKSLVEEGIAEGVDEEGALLLRRADGSVARVIAGEVSLRD